MPRLGEVGTMPLRSQAPCIPQVWKTWLRSLRSNAPDRGRLPGGSTSSPRRRAPRPPWRPRPRRVNRRGCGGSAPPGGRALRRPMPPQPPAGSPCRRRARAPDAAQGTGRWSPSGPPAAQPTGRGRPVPPVPNPPTTACRGSVATHPRPPRSWPLVPIPRHQRGTFLGRAPWRRRGAKPADRSIGPGRRCDAPPHAATAGLFDTAMNPSAGAVYTSPMPKGSAPTQPDPSVASRTALKLPVSSSRPALSRQMGGELGCPRPAGPGQPPGSGQPQPAMAVSPSGPRCHGSQLIASGRVHHPVKPTRPSGEVHTRVDSGWCVSHRGDDPSAATAASGS